MAAISRRQFESIFLNGNVYIAIEILLKFVPRGPINNIPALFQIMAWPRPLLLTLINFFSARKNNSMLVKVWDEIIDPYPKFNHAAGDIWEWINNFIPHSSMNMLTY